MQASPFTSSKFPSLPFEYRETDTDAAHPCSLVNATINGHSHVWKDKLLNRMSPCGYSCPSCRTLSAAAFSVAMSAMSLFNSLGFKILFFHIIYRRTSWTLDLRLSELWSQDPPQIFPPLLSPPILTAKQKVLSVPGPAHVPCQSSA